MLHNLLCNYLPGYSHYRYVRRGGRHGCLLRTIFRFREMNNSGDSGERSPSFLVLKKKSFDVRDIFCMEVRRGKLMVVCGVACYTLQRHVHGQRYVCRMGGWVVSKPCLSILVAANHTFLMFGSYRGLMYCTYRAWITLKSNIFFFVSTLLSSLDRKRESLGP